MLRSRSCKAHTTHSKSRFRLPANRHKSTTTTPSSRRDLMFLWSSLTPQVNTNNIHSYSVRKTALCLNAHAITHKNTLQKWNKIFFVQQSIYKFLSVKLFHTHKGKQSRFSCLKFCDFLSSTFDSKNMIKPQKKTYNWMMLEKNCAKASKKIKKWSQCTSHVTIN